MWSFRGPYGNPGSETQQASSTIVLYELEAQRSGFKLERKANIILRFSNRSEAPALRIGKEDGADGYGAFGALTETPEAEWNRLRLTPRGCNGFDGGVEAGIAGGCAYHP